MNTQKLAATLAAKWCAFDEQAIDAAAKAQDSQVYVDTMQSLIKDEIDKACTTLDKPKSVLIAFYRGEAKDAAGRTLDEILSFGDEEMERVHDFIQWTFPLPEPSKHNPDAPLLTDDDIAAFKSDPILQENLTKSFDRFLAFLGLLMTCGVVHSGDNFKSRFAGVWDNPNHNWLRITRVLRSMALLGMEKDALRFFYFLEDMYRKRLSPISENTFKYWAEATIQN